VARKRLEGSWGEAFIAHGTYEIPMGKISPIGKLPMGIARGLSQVKIIYHGMNDPI